MKRTAYATVAAAALGGLPALAFAQPVTGPYVSLGAGVNLQQDEIRRPIVATGFNHFFSFDPGAAGQGSIGYGLGYGVRVEIEGDYSSDKVKGFSPSSVPDRAGGNEQKWGGFGNVLYDIDVGLPVYPYVGAGLGGQVVFHDRFNASEPGFIYPQRENAQSHGAYAYQGIAGVSYPVPLLQGLSLTLEYRFIGLFDPIGFYDATRYHTTDTGETTATPYTARFSNDLNHQVMLGVRYAFGQPPAPPPAPPASAPPPPAPPETARTYLVFFDWDRADLSVRARQIVAEAASASTKTQTTTIEVDGYTDLSGTAEYNQRLSVRRAQSVQAELVRDGVPRNEIGTHGYGESNPLVPTAKGVREPQNRRVEIVLR